MATNVTNTTPQQIIPQLMPPGMSNLDLTPYRESVNMSMEDFIERVYNGPAWGFNIRNDNDLVVFRRILPPGHDLTLTIDAGRSGTLSSYDKILSNPPQFTSIVQLNLLSGWWHFFELANTDIDNPLWEVQRCSVNFIGPIYSNTGLGAHRNVFFNIQSLEHLVVKQQTTVYDVCEPLSFPGVTIRYTKLRILAITGVDIRTLAPALLLNPRLEKLRIWFTPSRPTPAFASLYLSRNTSAILDATLGPLYSHIEYLDFHHDLLTAHSWSRFRVLGTLRVHQCHIFPSYRQVWTGYTTLRQLLPLSLRKLIIHGLDFDIDPVQQRCIIVESLVRLGTQLQVHPEFALEEVVLLLNRGLDESVVPRRVKRAFRVGPGEGVVRLVVKAR